MDCERGDCTHIGRRGVLVTDLLAGDGPYDSREEAHKPSPGQVADIIRESLAAAGAQAPPSARRPWVIAGYDSIG